MNYYNAVLLYSSFHHGISKWFISVNYGTPWGGKREAGTHSSLLSSRQAEPTFPLDPAQPEPLPTAPFGELFAHCKGKVRAGHLRGVGLSQDSSCWPQHCPGWGCSGATIVIRTLQ